MRFFWPWIRIENLLSRGSGSEILAINILGPRFEFTNLFVVEKNESQNRGGGGMIQCTIYIPDTVWIVFAMNIANLWAQWIAKLTNNRKNNFQEASWPYSRPWALPRWSWWLPGCRQPAAAAGVTRWLPRRWAWHHRRLRPARLVAASSPGGKLAPYCTTVMNIIFFYQMKNHICSIVHT